ncbi:retropepsin-like aspartic protease family protein [Undibacterium sp. Ren11W]|uniref:retropepsin-like aspartic protease family protein n=1 Tax=Undibacterium sp. Ren11W TaxID=3413045 RepID=UPI003BF2F71E
MRHLSIFACLCACVISAHATDIDVVGLFPGKAVLVVNGSSPKTYAVGSVIADGAKLIAADNATATIEMHGKRQVLAIGQYVHRSAPSTNSSVTLQADTRGHFIARGQINGGGVSMLVDTGASVIAIPASEAIRLGINYKSGRMGRANTANGQVVVYIVQLDSVKIGDVELNQVEAMVQEQGLTSILLGMSFLNRMEMNRNGEQMVLTKRF